MILWRWDPIWGIQAEIFPLCSAVHWDSTGSSFTGGEADLTDFSFPSHSNWRDQACAPSVSRSSAGETPGKKLQPHFTSSWCWRSSRSSSCGSPSPSLTSQPVLGPCLTRSDKLIKIQLGLHFPANCFSGKRMECLVKPWEMSRAPCPLHHTVMAGAGVLPWVITTGLIINIYSYMMSYMIVIQYVNKIPLKYIFYVRYLHRGRFYKSPQTNFIKILKGIL